MSLNAVVSAQRLHIAFFGMRNAGKSSLVNAVTGQSLSVVSAVKGTTTDPVQKSMELLPLGPVVIIDTPGMDDEGDLGALRVQKAQGVLSKTDIAVLVSDASQGLTESDKELISLFEKRKLPYVIAYNKADLLSEIPENQKNEIYVSALTGYQVNALKETLGSLAPKDGSQKLIVADLLSPGDLTVLVIPIDEAAPKGRLILPQQQVMRELLDHHYSFIACQDTDLSSTLAQLSKKPKLVITDSQAFGKVAPQVPEGVLLTSFSILFARYKGDLNTLIEGASRLSSIKTGDRILISEGCTHHRQCNDIGTVKMPGWIRAFTAAEPEFTFTSGGEFPQDLSSYQLVVHCGGCMLNEQEMKSRLALCAQAGVPMVNYGIAIAQMHGILKKSLSPFPHLLQKLGEA